MNRMTDSQAFRVLHRARLRQDEIDRLRRLRRNAQATELEQPSLEVKRLEFAHWLVSIGRLTEQIPERYQASSSSVEQGTRRSFSLSACFPFARFMGKEHLNHA